MIITDDHKGDEAVLTQAVNTEARYIGMIGSKTKVKTLFTHLRDKGITQDRLDEIHTPIGLAIHAQTPVEIAVSILAEMIQVKRTPVPETTNKEEFSAIRT